MFDGERTLEHQTVLVHGGTIAAVASAEKVAIPTGVNVIDGGDATLLPGLIDSHVHVNSADDPRSALMFGVTTEIDMMSTPQISVALARDAAADHAQVIPAGYAATVPGGHGTEYGDDVPTLTTPDQAEAFVAERVREGSHHLKVMIETGAELGITIPSLNAPTIRALVVAAHRHKLLAVAHVGSAKDVTTALDDSIDVLAHVPVQTLDSATVQRIATARVFVVPTLTVLASTCGRHAGIEKEPTLVALLSPADARRLAASPPRPKRLECDAPAVTVRALHAAGVTILAGTDAPNPGTTHGLSLHDELARLVAAGLSPAEALVAATSAAARAFHLDGYGVVRVGAIADLVLVTGDPTRDITATRTIRAIWRLGKRVDRAARQNEVAAEWEADARARMASSDKLGLIAGFDEDREAPLARYGKITAASDKLTGGTSVAEIKIAKGGAAGSRHSLAVTGNVIANTAAGGWAGASFLPGDPSLQAIDLSVVKHIQFWTRGDNKTYYVIIYSGRGVPAFQEFTAGADWKRVTIDTAKFGVLLDNVITITWGQISLGPFAFQIDELLFE